MPVPGKRRNGTGPASPVAAGAAAKGGVLPDSCWGRAEERGWVPFPEWK